MTISKNLKKIVLFYPYLTGAGGAERLLWEEEKFFRNKGVETIVLTYFIDQAALYDYKPKKLNVIKLNSKASYLSYIIALRQELNRINPDIVISLPNYQIFFATIFTSIYYIGHIHGTMFWFIDDTMKYTLMYKGVFKEIRESVTGHKEFISAYPPKGARKRILSELLAIIDYLAIRKARKIITLTDQLKWEIKKLYGIEAIVSRGCLPKEALSYEARENLRKKLGLEESKIIFSVGRLDPRKRIDILIRAFSKIKPKYENIFLLIGGTGEDMERLKNLAEELKITKNVMFVGFIKESELFDYYAACDIFAFPSWTTSGITPYEALASGKKVVWTTEADEPILGDKHVFMAEPDVDDFARGLEEALNTEVEGNIDLSDYTWDSYFETVYKTVIEAINGQRSK